MMMKGNHVRHMNDYICRKDHFNHTKLDYCLLKCNLVSDNEAIDDADDDLKIPSTPIPMNNHLFINGKVFLHCIIVEIIM